MLTLDDGEPPVTIHSPCPPNVIPILDRHSAVIEWHSTRDPDSALHHRGRGPGQGPVFYLLAIKPRNDLVSTGQLLSSVSLRCSRQPSTASSVAAIEMSRSPFPRPQGSPAGFTFGGW